MTKSKVDNVEETSAKTDTQSHKSSKSGSKSKKNKTPQNGETRSAATGTKFFLAPKAALDPSLESLFASSVRLHPYPNQVGGL